LVIFIISIAYSLTIGSSFQSSFSDHYTE